MIGCSRCVEDSILDTGMVPLSTILALNAWRIGGLCCHESSRAVKEE